MLNKTEEIEFPEHDHPYIEQGLVDDIFPDITRKSFLVTLLIALDDQFKIYCQILKQATGAKLKWNELRGSALERFISYSEKVCGIPSVCDQSNRQRIIGLIEVRNCIVHNNSSVEGFAKSKVVEAFSKQVSGLEIKDSYITLELEACHYCADVVFEFMKHAYDAALAEHPE